MRAIWPVTTLAIAGCMGSEIAPEKEAWQGTYFPPTGSSGAALTADQAASMEGLTFRKPMTTWFPPLVNPIAVTAATTSTSAQMDVTTGFATTRPIPQSLWKLSEVYL